MGLPQPPLSVSSIAPHLTYHTQLLRSATPPARRTAICRSVRPILQSQTLGPGSGSRSRLACLQGMKFHTHTHRSGSSHEQHGRANSHVPRAEQCAHETGRRGERDHMVRLPVHDKYDHGAVAAAMPEEPGNSSHSTRGLWRRVQRQRDAEVELRHVRSHIRGCRVTSWRIGWRM